MIRTSFRLLLAMTLFVAHAAGGRATAPLDQQPQDQRKQDQSKQERKDASRKEPNDQEEVLRVRTNLVELSAVVTDKRGQAVENLSKEDFELLENERPQPISFFTVERVGGAASPPATTSASAAVINTPGASGETSRANSAPSSPAAVGRTVVLFVDALHLTPSGLMNVKKALTRFVETQMTENDLVAVVSTGASGALLGQLTRDRNLLRAAIARLSPQSVQTPSFFTPYLAAQILREDNMDGEATTLAARIIRAEEGLRVVVMDPERKDPDYLQKVYARQKAPVILAEEAQRRRASMASLRAVAEHLANLPGQRLVAYFSEGFSMVGARGEPETGEIESVTSRAARSGVVIYSIDARGLAANPVFDVSAGDFDAGAGQTSQMSAYLSAAVTESQNGMNALARDTGGEPFFNTNDLNRALGRALEENRVYYRIAYHSPEGDDTKFRRVSLSVKNHPDYKVRTQRGYRVEPEAAEALKTPAQKLIAAMLSPLTATAIPVDASAGFYVGAGDEAQVTFRAHIDASRLDWGAQSGDTARVDLEVLTAIYDLAGKPVASFPEKIQSTLRAGDVELAKRNGIDSVKRLSLKPGLYQIRVGVREPSTERVGTSSVVVEVPDLSLDRLTLSSVFLRADLNQADATDAKGASRPAPREEFRQGLRVFRRGEPLIYQFRVYHGEGAHEGGGDGANLSMQLELRQGERTIYQSPWQQLAPLIVRRDAKGTEVGGQLRATLPPGSYELGVRVRDERRKKTVGGAVEFAVEP
jgi:VWFA-related protein